MNVHVEFSNKPLTIQVEESDTTNVKSEQQIVRSYVDRPALPPGGQTGDIIIKRSDADFDAEWVPPANHSEADNTRPITAAAVYAEIGNINALLAII